MQNDMFKQELQQHNLLLDHDDPTVFVLSEAPNLAIEIKDNKLVVCEKEKYKPTNMMQQSKVEDKINKLNEFKTIEQTNNVKPIEKINGYDIDR